MPSIDNTDETIIYVYPSIIINEQATNDVNVVAFHVYTVPWKMS